MYLAIDQGNTSTKVGLSDGKASMEVFLWDNKVHSVTDLLKRYPLKAAVFSSVSENGKEEWVEELTETIPVTKLDHKTPLPVTNTYETPESLGYDRIAGAVGAASLFPNQHNLVIDTGTCINYEFITAENEYLGGAIAPGLQMRFRAMHEFTGKLPLIDTYIQPTELTGKSTSGSLLSGVMNGMLYEIDGVINQYTAKYGNINAILTGGDADYFGKYLKNQTFAQPDLVLLGLLEIVRFIDEKNETRE